MTRLSAIRGSRNRPEISHISSGISFVMPCTWQIKTDRVDTALILKGENDIRRIGQNSLLAADNHGIHFLVRELLEIDEHSRKILDRFFIFNHLQFFDEGASSPLGVITAELS